jgi:phospholipid-binding lipoprotein MlaA
MSRTAPHRAALAAGLLFLTALGLGACATKPPASDVEAMQDYNQTNDPLEPTNRFFFKLDNKLERYTIKPVSRAYVYVLPQPVRTSVHNVLANLNSPVLFVDDVSQANPHWASFTLVRFLVNSTAGLGGLFDVASDLGVTAHHNSFAETLALWGLPAGPYLYLPLLGPSSPRDLTGYGVDVAADPFTWVPHGYGLLTLNWARYGLGVVDKYSRFGPDLEKIEAGALDPYATIRSLYRQNFAASVAQARRDTQATPWGAKPQPQ